MDVLELRPLRHPDVAWRSWDGEVVILSPAGHDPGAPQLQQDGAEHDLNDVGSRIWELCDGTRSVREIAGTLAREFEVDETTAASDAGEFVAELLGTRLLLPTPAEPGLPDTAQPPPGGAP